MVAAPAQVGRARPMQIAALPVEMAHLFHWLLVTRRFLFVGSLVSFYFRRKLGGRFKRARRSSDPKRRNFCSGRGLERPSRERVNRRSFTVSIFQFWTTITVSITHLSEPKRRTSLSHRLHFQSSHKLRTFSRPLWQAHKLQFSIIHLPRCNVCVYRNNQTDRVRLMRKPTFHVEIPAPLSRQML